MSKFRKRIERLEGLGILGAAETADLLRYLYHEELGYVSSGFRECSIGLRQLLATASARRDRERRGEPWSRGGPDEAGGMPPLHCLTAELVLGAVGSPPDPAAVAALVPSLRCAWLGLALAREPGRVFNAGPGEARAVLGVYRQESRPSPRELEDAANAMFRWWEGVSPRGGPGDPEDASLLIAYLLENLPEPEGPDGQS